MKNLLTVTLLICFFIWLPAVHAQTSSKALTPLQFSDKMSEITDSLYARGSAWGAHFNEANKAKNFSSLKPYREAVDVFILQSMRSLREMKDVNNSKSLRTAMIGFLEFEHKMVVEGFTPIEKITSSATEEDVQKVLQNLQSLAAKESDELKKVAKEQEAYATANGFKIESAEEAGDKDQK